MNNMQQEKTAGSLKSSDGSYHYIARVVLGIVIVLFLAVLGFEVVNRDFDLTGWLF